MKLEIELGEFDTGLYSGCEFGHGAGSAWLTIHVDEYGNKTIAFQKVRFYKFTSLYNCTPQMIKAYFNLFDLGNTDELLEYKKNDMAKLKPYSDLKHFRIFLDETGCYDIFAESAKIA